MNIIRKIVVQGLIAVLALATLSITGCEDESRLTHDQAVTQLSTLVSNVNWLNDPGTRAGTVPLNPNSKIEDTLPPIGKYPLTVDPAVAGDDIVVEIFVTTIRGWSPAVGGRTRTADGLTTEIAQAFNESNQLLIGGRRAKVRVRYIASGTAYQFIAAGIYMPDAYTPVHHLWIRMLDASGIPVTKIRESMARSTGGIVVKSEIADQLRSTHGDLDVKTVIDEVVQGDLAMGYTNPFASSTGLNFLATILSTFADGDEDRMLSDAVADTFVKFQRNVPFIALTTVEMRESVLSNSGSLDAFVMGYQSFISTKALQSGFEFIPFGVAHDQPLYAVGDPGPAKLEALELFARFAERPEYRELAVEYGWSLPLANEFTPTIEIPSGETLIEAQKLWKDKKDSERPIAAVFLSDVSGSMAGTRLNGVRQALITGSEFVNPETSIGLVLFSDTVRQVLPIEKFSLNQRARFVAAVEDMTHGGNTAMYDGIVVSLAMLVQEKRDNPDVVPMLFVLTDGEANAGYRFAQINKMVEGLGIPVHTIGYEANIAELKKISRLVEAASINAEEDDVVYKLANLLNTKT